MCLAYSKCEAFLYFDDMRCYLFYLNSSVVQINEKIESNSNRNYFYGFKATVFITRVNSVSFGNDSYLQLLQTNSNECIKKCSLDLKCAGITVSMSRNECFLYKVIGLTEKFLH